MDRLSGVSAEQNIKERIATTCRKILRNRDGKNTEEIYAISLKTGKKISSITDQHKAFYIKRTNKFLSDIKRAEENSDKVIFMHNHPRGLPPSSADVNELISHDSAVGITVGHNGSLYYYTKPSKIISDVEYALALDHFKCYNDDVLRAEKTLERLARLYDFEFKIL